MTTVPPTDGPRLRREADPTDPTSGEAPEPGGPRRSSRLRVGVNLLWLVPDDVGGSEDYAVRMLGALGERDDAVALHLFAPPSFAVAHPALVERWPTTIAPFDTSSRWRRIWGEATWLRRVTATSGLDLVHHLGGTLPIGGSPLPAVVTIHDLQPLQLQGTFTRAKQAYLRWRLPATIRGADAVCVVSGFVRQTVIDQLRARPEVVEVVSAGYQAPQPPPTPPDAEMRTRYRLPPRWILYPVITYPHKDHATLVAAFAEIAERHPEVGLVLTGRADRAEADLVAQVERLGLAHRVRRLGRIPRGDLDRLLVGADLLAFPSRYEGFGLGVLEALAAGVPVVAADATALPEVVGDAGLLVTPGDVGAWAEALHRVLTDGGLQTRLAVEGPQRAGRWTWHRAAEAQIAAYRAAQRRGG